MDGLRWLLLFFGLLVVAGVYFYSRREQKPVQKDLPFDRRAPTLEPAPPKAGAGLRVEPSIDSQQRFVDEDLEAADETVVDEGKAEEAPTAEQAAPGEQKIVTLRLVARDKGSFKGDELILSMRGIGLRRGKFGIFHRFEENEDGPVIFSAASLVEPGHFDIENIKEQEFPGISLFMVIPGPVVGADAFDLMIAAARALAQSLDGELLDESGSTFSIQRERYMREEIVQFEHTHKVA
jgi:cell division protein ZipA